MAKPEVKISIRSDYDSSGTQAATGWFGKLKTSIGEADGVGGKFKAGFASVGESVKANAGALALAGGAAFVAFGVKALGAFQDVAQGAIDVSKSIGSTVENASRLKAVGDDFGVTGEAIGKAGLAISKSLDAPKWKEFGIDTRDATGHVRDGKDIMLDALAVISKYPTEQERTAAGNKLFGKSFDDIARLVGHTREEYDDMLSTVEKGQVITTKEAEKSERMRKAQDQLGDAINEVTLAVGGAVAGLAPYLETISKIITKINQLSDAAGPDGLIGGLAQAPGAANDVGNLTKQLDGMTDSAIASGDAIGYFVDRGYTVDFATKRIEEYKATQAAALKETNKHSDAMEHAGITAQDLGGAVEATGGDLRTAAEAAADAKRQTDLLDASWRAFFADLSGQKATLELENSFADVQSKGREAFEAAATGADDAAQKARDYQLSLIDLKGKVGEYAQAVGGISPQQVTYIAAQIDNGSITTAEGVLNALGRARQVVYNAQVAGHREYASGTSSAKPGAATVAERGRPEFVDFGNGVPVLFGGGEKVYSGSQTADMLRNRGGAVYVDQRTEVHNYPPGVTPEALIKAQRRADRRGLTS